MSESFRSLRHLTTYVDDQVRIYTQLQAAIAQVGGILDLLPERKKELEAVEAAIATAKHQAEEQAAAQQLLVEQVRGQRRETAEVMKKEQQERVTAREAWRLEAQTRQAEIVAARETLADVQRQIEQKKAEAETLEKELASTVKAVLRR